ncbi:MAG: hypothetical protein JJD92_11335 [Frankiaceae bacterium]|nr:hypothetical protein [Frankiaceae bacterium]
MTTFSLPRRAIVGSVLAASLIGTGLVTAFADDAPAGGCPAWTDPKGDSTTAQEPSGNLTDANLDIVAATASTTADKVIVTITTDGMAAGASDAGDEFGLDLTIGDADLFIAADRQVDDTSTAHVGSYADPTIFEDATAAFDVKAKTVTITAPVASLKAAAGADVAGKPATALSAYTANAIPFAEFGFLLYDDAESKATLTIGTDCAGGAPAPAPAPSASPSPEPSPTAAPAPPVAGGGDPSKLPTADCLLAKDPKGDAHVINANVPNDPDVDLTGLTLGSDAKNLYAYIKVDKLAAGPQIHDGHRFYVNFTHNKHTFTMAGSAFKNGGSAQFKDGLAQTGQVAHVTQLAVDGVSNAADPERVTGNGPGFVESGLKYVFDEKTSTVTAILPIADVEKYGKAPAAGAVLTGVYAGAYGDAYAVAQPADTVPDGATTPETSKVTYALGDNHCFGVPTPPLSSVGAVKAQYGDIAAVAAKLVDAAGAPVAGKTVTFALGASKATAVTGADGIAKGALTVKDKAGTRKLTITAEGATASVSFTVLVEKTALKAVNNKGTINATLTDDDRKPVTGQVVTFTSGSKKVTARTDAKGVAKAAGLPAGNIKVTYAGAAGMYTAASTTTKA